MSNNVFGGYKEPKKGKEKELNLPHLVIAIEAQNPKNAAVLIEAEFIKKYPDTAEHYFAAKVFEDRPGLPRGALNEFTSEFFNWGVRWNKELKDMEPVNAPAEKQSKAAEPQFIEAAKLPVNIRSALLAMFGRTTKITKTEYSLAIDLTNDTEPSFARELGEALTHTPRVHALYEEKAADLLAAVRKNVPDNSQWPAIKKFIDGWMDTPVEKRERPVRQGPFYFKRSETGECGDVFTLDRLDQLCDDGCVEITKVEFLQWRDEMALIAAEEGPSTPADNREELSARQVEICLALNELMSGRTSVMTKVEADGVVAGIGLAVSDIFPLLIVDLETTECLVHPNFSNEEIHDVATSLLDAWSSDISTRQKVVLDEIVKWRKEAVEAARSNTQGNTPASPLVVQEEPAITLSAPSLTYHRQLTLAALQGLCANPAHATSFDELPSMARHLADVLAAAEV